MFPAGDMDIERMLRESRERARKLAAVRNEMQDMFRQTGQQAQRMLDDLQQRLGLRSDLGKSRPGPG